MHNNYNLPSGSDFLWFYLWGVLEGQKNIRALNSLSFRSSGVMSTWSQTSLEYACLLALSNSYWTSMVYDYLSKEGISRHEKCDSLSKEGNIKQSISNKAELLYHVVRIFSFSRALLTTPCIHGLILTTLKHNSRVNLIHRLLTNLELAKNSQQMKHFPLSCCDHTDRGKENTALPVLLSASVLTPLAPLVLTPALLVTESTSKGIFFSVFTKFSATLGEASVFLFFSGLLVMP